MTKKVVKMLAVVLVALVLVATISPTVLGTSFKDIQVGTVTDSAQDTTVVQIVGVGVAVIMLIVLAIKYISAAPGDKADIKKHAVVYVVGAVVLFAASGILEIVKNFAGNVHAD